MPRERQTHPLKKSNDDLSVRDARGAARLEGTEWHAPREVRRGPSRRTNSEFAHRRWTTQHRLDDRDVEMCDRTGRVTDAERLIDKQEEGRAMIVKISLNAVLIVVWIVAMWAIGP